MTTYYVSNSASNGYALGSDANAGTSKALPKLTIAGGYAAASDGDTVVINDGTYNNAAYVSMTKDLVIAAENSRQVTVTVTAAQGRVFHFSGSIGANKTAKLSGLVIDGGGETYAISMGDPATTGVEFEIDDCIVRNNGTGTAGIVDDTTDNTTRITNTRLEGSVRYGYLGAGGSAQVNDKITILQDVEFALSGDGVNPSYGILLQAHATRAAELVATVQRVTGTVTPADNDGYVGILVTGGGSQIAVTDCDFTVADPGQLAGYEGISVLAETATNPISDLDLSGNTVAFLPGAGYAIQVGQGTVTSYITGGRIKGNRVTGAYFAAATPHGIAWGRGIDGLAISGNYVEGTYAPFRASICTDFSAYGNIAHNCYGECFYSKGLTSGAWRHNLAIYDDATLSVRAASLAVSAQDATNNTAATYQHNLVVDEVDALHSFVRVDTLQVGTFVKNAYYSSGTLPATAWSYQGSNYGTLSAWQTAQESDAMDDDPQMIGYVTDANALIGAASKWWGNTPNPLGYDDEPLADASPSIGAVQSKRVPFHPLNL